MTSYRRAGVASAISPTFVPILAEALNFAAHVGAELEIFHAAEYEAGKEQRFQEALVALNAQAHIRWVAEHGELAAILTGAAQTAGCDLLMAGALAKEDSERPFSNGVARALLRATTCDLLLFPGPSETPGPPAHIVFALEPGGAVSDWLRQSVSVLRPEKVTLATLHSPFTQALAASRGEEHVEADAWLEGLADDLSGTKVEIDTFAVPSNTGFTLCDAIQGMNAGLLVVRADPATGALPRHMDWLYQVIPTRLLLVRN